MWNCPHCDEAHPDGFGVCWNCGTDRNGVRDQTFRAVRDGLPEDEATSADRRSQAGFWTRVLFLGGLFILSMMSAIVVNGGFATFPYLVVLLAAIALVNLLGAAAGWGLTHICRFPNDGSLTWKQEPRRWKIASGRMRRSKILS